MPDLFNKPLELLTLEDVRGILGWPETLTVEYKGELPGRDGRDDSWLAGGDVERYARDKIFKEIVALANTSGGHVFIGVGEKIDGDGRSIAGALNLLPRCGPLADRLLRSAAQLIDPPIPLLLSRGVEAEGGSGIVVFRVPESRFRPHRSSDKECYVRRGTESTPMTMREIQDMVFSSGRRDELMDCQFKRAHENLQDWHSRPLEGAQKIVGFRITAIPTSGAINLGRLYGRQDLLAFKEKHLLTLEKKPLLVSSLGMPEICRPFVRGAQWTMNLEGPRLQLDLHQNGAVNLFWRAVPRADIPYLPLEWLTAYLLNVCGTIEKMRTEAGMPDLEYGVELEIFCFPISQGLRVLPFHAQSPENSGIGRGLLDLPFVFPRVSFGPTIEVYSLLNILIGDVCDACAAPFGNAPIFSPPA